MFLLFSFSVCIAQQLEGADNLSKINLVFAGDIMGHGPQIRSAEIVKDLSYDYLPCFEYISPVLERYDLAIGNL